MGLGANAVALGPFRKRAEQAVRFDLHTVPPSPVPQIRRPSPPRFSRSRGAKYLSSTTWCPVLLSFLPLMAEEV